MCMTDAEYQVAQDQCAMLASLALNLPDLDAMLARIATADSIGPIYDPTLYRAAFRKLEQVRELVAACNHLKRVVLQHQAIHFPEVVVRDTAGFRPGHTVRIGNDLATVTHVEGHSGLRVHAPRLDQ